MITFCDKHVTNMQEKEKWGEMKKWGNEDMGQYFFHSTAFTFIFVSLRNKSSAFIFFLRQMTHCPSLVYQYWIF